MFPVCAPTKTKCARCYEMPYPVAAFRVSLGVCPKLAIREALSPNVAIAKRRSGASRPSRPAARAYGATKLGGQNTLTASAPRAIRRARPRLESRRDGRLLRRRNGDGDGRGDRPDLRSPNSSSRAAPRAALR